MPAASREFRARRAFLRDSAGPTSIDMSTRPEHESDRLCGNRFAVLSGLSGEQELPHGSVGQGVPRRRLVLINMESGVVRPSEHILCNTESMGEVEARPRGGEFQVHRDVQDAKSLVQDRIKVVSLHVPLMWGAAGIPRRVHRTLRSSSSWVGFIAGHAELGHFLSRRFGDLVADERAICLRGFKNAS